MTPIKFGTDGWRAIIAKDFTTENITRVAEATALWLLKNFQEPSVVLGHDTRFGGELFAETTCKVLCSHNIKVFLATDFVSTPMISLGTVKFKANLGIVITASHNPPAYNGFKLKGSFGGPLQPEKIEEIENLIPEKQNESFASLNLIEFETKGLVQRVDLETMYCDYVEGHFDLDAIRKSGLRLGYDAMFGAGQNIIGRLLPNTALLHCENNPSYNGQAPEPIDKNLQQFSGLIKRSNAFDCGFATDGDADRIGLYDNSGKFIDSNHIILLLIKYLCEVKGMHGKVVTSFSVTSKVKKMCEHFGLEHVVTKIGFKYIASIMATNNVLLGGEESGGIAIKGHIPERDGIWIGLTIWEYMAKSGKSLQELIKDVYAIVGPFTCERSDLHLTENAKNEIIENCKNNAYKQFGNCAVQKTETVDGYKYFFNDDEWLLIRASGTEPVLRNYVESSCAKKTSEILNAVQNTLLEKKPATLPTSSTA
jgi:phosphomannomutase